MAKPIMYFKGVRFKAGTTEGYRPQLSTSQKVADSALAEEICIEAGLAMSPTELLHAIQMTLETTPRLVANDGRVREFTNLLAWNRTASGRLDGPASPWNDSCSAKVTVQLKKNTKQLIDGNFVNEISMPVPKLDNVTWIGAQGVTNCIKLFKPFAAYGRNMQFNSSLGDEAYVYQQGGGVTPAAYPCACTSSDAAHAVFDWPTGMTAVEPGTTVEFVMTTRGGIEGGTPTTTRKKVVVLASGLKEVKITSMVAKRKMDGDVCEIVISGENLDGAEGWVGGANPHFDATVATENATNVQTFASSDGGQTYKCEVWESCWVGETVRMYFMVEPTSTEHVHGTVTKTTTVVEG